jgi:hypothetical protein
VKILKRTPRTDSGRPIRPVKAPKVRRALPAGQAPRWVTWFTDIGRPLSAVVVMVLCAPGERHLAELAGWGPNLSWGMAGLLVMYAGIAAVVATIRPKGAPGKRTAVLGAILSLLLAMAAQPVSHYFVTGWMTAQPRPPFWLVTVVSCVPPFVMGHLLHLAADPGTGTEPDAVRRYEAGHVRPADLLSTMSGEPDTSPVTVAEMVTTLNPDSGQPDTADAVDSEPDIFPPEDVRMGEPERVPDIPWSPEAASWSPDMADEPEGGLVRDTSHSSRVTGRFIGDPAHPSEAPGSRTAGRFMDDLVRSEIELTLHGSMPGEHPGPGYRDPVESALMYPQGETPDSIRELADGVMGLADLGHGQDMLSTVAPTPGRASISGAELSGWIRDLWTLDPDMTKADIRTAVRQRFPDIKADTVRKAVTRVEEAIRT